MAESSAVRRRGRGNDWGKEGGERGVGGGGRAEEREGQEEEAGRGQYGRQTLGCGRGGGKKARRGNETQ